MRYRAFRTKKDNQFYFQFLTDGGDVVLKSQAYSSKADCFTGIRSVMDNADNADRYEAVPGDDGAFAFRLKAGNNVEIARSVGYATEDEVNNMIALCQKEIPTANSGAAAEKPKAEVTKSSMTSSSSGSSSGGGSGSKRGDDYRPLAFYQENISGVENGFDTCTDSDEWYFTYNMNGQIILISEGYNSEAGRDNGIESVKKNMGNPDRYKKGIHENGKHFFGLRAGNHQEIATSRWCEDEAEVDLTIQALTTGNASLLAPAVVKSMAPSGDDGHSQDEYLGCDAYTGEVGFHTFEHEGKYYFSYNGAGGVTWLRSQGYKSEAARDNGIESVKKNGPIEKRWTTGNEGDNWYYALKAGNHQEIARSCDYSSEADMNAAYAGATNAMSDKPEVVASMAADAGHQMDEYLGCDAYAGAEGFTSFEKDGEYYFGYNDGNGQTLLRSQGYKSEAARDNGIASVKKNGPIHERWTMGDDNGKWYYALKAGNHQEIARSCDYATEKEMKSAYVDATYSFEEKPAVVAAAAAPEATHENDEYLGCNAYAGAVGFHIFDREGEYYFGYNDGNGKTLLRSQGYKSEAARDNGMESVKKNGPIEKRWTMGNNDGQWYYALKAGNHQEIARSCDYATEEEMKSAFVSARYAFEDKPDPVVVKSAAAPIIEKVTETKTTAAAPTPASSKIADDYMPCEAYTGGAGFHTFFDETRKEYYFAYNDKDGNTLLRSEGYTTEAARDNGIASVKKNAPIEKRWKKETALNGKYHYYVLKAGNNQEIARSCYYEDNEQMNTNFMLLGGAFATVGGGGVVSSMTSSSSSSSSSKVVKSTPAPVKKEKEDDYLPCREYEGKTVNDKVNNVALFKHDNGQFYFVMYRQDGSVRLRSEGFETAEGRDQELSGVLKYSDDKEMYSRIERGDYYIDVLKDKTGREVGRSCLQKVAPPAPPKSKEKEDDYLRCKEYTNRKVNDKVNNVALFKHENGQYYFAIYNPDGSVRLRSEGFGTAKGRDEELSGALKNVNNKDMYETIQKGGYYLNVLKDKTGREVGRSCMKKERVPVIPASGGASSSSMAAGGALLAGTVASKVVGGKMEHKSSKLKEKVVVPAAVPKPEAPKAKDYHSPPPPPKEVKVVAAAAAPKAAAAAGGGFNWRWLLPLLLLIPLLLWWMGGCNGCNKATPPPPPPVVKDTVVPPPPPPVKTALCPTAGDMKLAAGAGSNVCSYLSDPESNYPKRFNFDKVSFSRNGARLNTAARKSLDDLAVCLKGCENTSVDIYGYIGGKERSSYRGSKEVSLDDVRARAVYDYLKKRGISDSRMSFQGEGTDDSSNIVVQISEQ